jgi:hypothetical protein
VTGGNTGSTFDMRFPNTRYRPDALWGERRSVRQSNVASWGVGRDPGIWFRLVFCDFRSVGEGPRKVILRLGSESHVSHNTMSGKALLTITRATYPNSYPSSII